MGTAKKKPKKKIVYESFQTGRPTGNFMMLYWDMLDSKAWQELSAYEIQIYLSMLRKYQRKVKDGVIDETNSDDISMPKNEYETFMHRDTFFKSIDGLIEKGFVRVMENRRHIRKCIIYGFVDKWQEYGQQGYEIPINWKRNPTKNKK